MRRRWLLGLLLILVVTLSASCGGTDAAKQGVSDFRARVARGSFAGIYRAASPEFRQAVTEERFQRFMTGLERKLGPWQSAQEPVWKVTRGTGGHFVHLTYQSQFAKGPCLEQFAWRIDHGAAMLVRYDVNSTLLVSD
jgi:Protein of unknown function (DUF4019)